MAIDEKTLSVLYSLADEQQKTVTLLIQGLQAQIGELKTAAVAARNAAALGSQAATAVAQAAQRAERAAHDGAHGAVGPAMDNALAGVAGAIDAALAKATDLSTSRLHNAASTFETAAARADQELRRSAKWFGTKALLLVAVSVVVGWLFGWGGILWEGHQHQQLVEQNEALRADIESLKTGVSELEAKGGRIKLRPGGCEGRLCIEASSNQGAGNEGWKPPWKDDKGVKFVIPKGY